MENEVQDTSSINAGESIYQASVCLSELNADSHDDSFLPATSRYLSIIRRRPKDLSAGDGSTLGGCLLFSSDTNDSTSFATEDVGNSEFWGALLSSSRHRRSKIVKERNLAFDHLSSPINLPSTLVKYKPSGKEEDPFKRAEADAADEAALRSAIGTEEGPLLSLLGLTLEDSKKNPNDINCMMQDNTPPNEDRPLTGGQAAARAFFLKSAMMGLGDGGAATDSTMFSYRLAKSTWAVTRALKTHFRVTYQRELRLGAIGKESSPDDISEDEFDDEQDIDIDQLGERKNDLSAAKGTDDIVRFFNEDCSDIESESESSEDSEETAALSAFKFGADEDTEVVSDVSDSKQRPLSSVQDGGSREVNYMPAVETNNNLQRDDDRAKDAPFDENSFLASEICKIPNRVRRGEIGYDAFVAQVRKLQKKARLLAAADRAERRRVAEEATIDRAKKIVSTQHQIIMRRLLSQYTIYHEKGAIQVFFRYPFHHWDELHIRSLFKPLVSFDRDISRLLFHNRGGRFIVVYCPVQLQLIKAIHCFVSNVKLGRSYCFVDASCVVDYFWPCLDDLEREQEALEVARQRNALPDDKDEAREAPFGDDSQRNSLLLSGDNERVAKLKRLDMQTEGNSHGTAEARHSALLRAARERRQAQLALLAKRRLRSLRRGYLGLLVRQKVRVALRRGHNSNEGSSTLEVPTEDSMYDYADDVECLPPGRGPVEQKLLQLRGLGFGTDDKEANRAHEKRRFINLFGNYYVHHNKGLINAACNTLPPIGMDLGLESMHIRLNRLHSQRCANEETGQLAECWLSDRVARPILAQVTKRRLLLQCHSSHGNSPSRECLLAKKVPCTSLVQSVAPFTVAFSKITSEKEKIDTKEYLSKSILSGPDKRKPPDEYCIPELPLQDRPQIKVLEQANPLLIPSLRNPNHFKSETKRGALTRSFALDISRANEAAEPDPAHDDSSLCHKEDSFPENHFERDNVALISPAFTDATISEYELIPQEINTSNITFFTSLLVDPRDVKASIPLDESIRDYDHGLYVQREKNSTKYTFISRSTEDPHRWCSGLAEELLPEYIVGECPYTAQYYTPKQLRTSAHSLARLEMSFFSANNYDATLCIQTVPLFSKVGEISAGETSATSPRRRSISLIHATSEADDRHSVNALRKSLSGGLRASGSSFRASGSYYNLRSLRAAAAIAAEEEQGKEEKLMKSVSLKNGDNQVASQQLRRRQSIRRRQSLINFAGTANEGDNAPPFRACALSEAFLYYIDGDTRYGDITGETPLSVYVKGTEHHQRSIAPCEETSCTDSLSLLMQQ